MKEAKKDPFEERMETVFSISQSLKMTLVRNALRYKLSPSEMTLVAAHFSAVLCLSTSNHFDIGLSKVVDVFYCTMKQIIEIEQIEK